MHSNLKPDQLLTHQRLLTLIALSGCAVMISSCLGFGTGAVPEAAQGERPKVETPAEARQSCPIYVLPPSPTGADLEIGYATRGTQIVSCDAWRGVAVAAKDREQEALDAWDEARERRRSWNCRWLRIGC